jgi:hypothetical protein
MNFRRASAFDSPALAGKRGLERNGSSSYSAGGKGNGGIGRGSGSGSTTRFSPVTTVIINNRTEKLSHVEVTINGTREGEEDESTSAAALDYASKKKDVRDGSKKKKAAAGAPSTG